MTLFFAHNLKLLISPKLFVFPPNLRRRGKKSHHPQFLSILRNFIHILFKSQVKGKWKWSFYFLSISRIVLGFSYKSAERRTPALEDIIKVCKIQKKYIQDSGVLEEQISFLESWEKRTFSHQMKKVIFANFTIWSKCLY